MLIALLEIEQSNPELLQIIEQNQEAFIRMIKESDDGSTSGSDSMSLKEEKYFFILLETEKWVY